ncbi:conserved phage C-terminal domain-containing protein [Salipaludibacillus sp. CF4.18]|uniref:conserved phage C-terminal domain-containing protein n=1 Tax=Salipaludibacillus sp. CF4.18 TaxID=3373081 RepID=UPI003EE5CE50
MNTGNSIVDSIGRMHISGTVIPFPWFQQLTFSSGKPHIPAILILADVLYWYRPTVERDEDTGSVVKVKKKFAKDMMHRNYKAFAEQFGISKRQVKEACDYLSEEGLIRREFRSVIAKGQVNNNVMFIEPCPEKISEITFTLLRSDVPPYYDGKGESPTLKRKTNTLITTEITKDIIVYLNDKAGKNFKATNQKTKKLIQARLNESFVLEDFKQVINIKVSVWKNDSRMNAYLRPETLFGTKFESYLNEKASETDNDDLYAFAEKLEEGEDDES